MLLCKLGERFKISIFAYNFQICALLCVFLFGRYLTSAMAMLLFLTLLLPQSSIDDLVFSVFPSNVIKLSYKISLLKN